MTKDSKRRAYPDRIIEVVNDGNMGEALLDEALRVIKSDQHSIGDWIDLLSGIPHKI